MLSASGNQMLLIIRWLLPSKWRATGRTLKELSAGRSFSEFNNHRVNNFQIEPPLSKPRQPTAVLAERFRNQKTAVGHALNGSYRSLRQATSLHHKSLAVQKNYDRRKRPVRKRINAECLKCKAISCSELGKVIFPRDPYTGDRIGLCASGEGK